MKILIIKLGALGDVLRTTPILEAYQVKDPGCKITWLVDPAHADILENNPRIDRVVAYTGEGLRLLKKESFDVALNLDKEPEALEAIFQVSAQKKMGFGRKQDGTLSPLDALSDYAYRLGIDDELKFKTNKKTYQEISFEQAGLRFEGQEYVYTLGEDSILFAKKHLKSLGFDALSAHHPVIGINTGSGNRFAGKRLPESALAKLAEMFQERLNAAIFLLGGQDEIERNLRIQKKVARPLINTGSHAIGRFAAIVRECDLVISGDTTAMHIAIATKVPVVVYFASTCPAEIELYGRGQKIVSAIECAPCYKKICPIDEQCMKDMGPEVLFKAAEKTLCLKETKTR